MLSLLLLSYQQMILLSFINWTHNFPCWLIRIEIIGVHCDQITFFGNYNCACFVAAFCVWPQDCPCNAKGQNLWRIKNKHVPDSNGVSSERQMMMTFTNHERSSCSFLNVFSSSFYLFVEYAGIVLRYMVKTTRETKFFHFKDSNGKSWNKLRWVGIKRRIQKMAIWRRSRTATRPVYALFFW